MVSYWIYTFHTRGTPRVQFANIRKMVLCQGLPHCIRLFTDPCMARHAQSLNSSLYAWPQNLELFRPRGNGRKRTKCDRFFCPKSDFFRFLQSMFLLSYLYQWCRFCWQSLCRNLWPVCLHSSFARLKNKHMWRVTAKGILSRFHLCLIYNY